MSSNFVGDSRSGAASYDLLDLDLCLNSFSFLTTVRGSWQAEGRARNALTRIKNGERLNVDALRSEPENTRTSGEHTNHLIIHTNNWKRVLCNLQ